MPFTLALILFTLATRALEGPCVAKSSRMVYQGRGTLCDRYWAEAGFHGATPLRIASLAPFSRSSYRPVVRRPTAEERKDRKGSWHKIAACLQDRLMNWPS